MATESREKKKKSMSKKLGARLRYIILVLAVILLAIYLIGVFYYGNHYYSNDSIFGINLKNRDPDQVKELINKDVQRFQLTIHAVDADYVLEAEDVNLHYDDQGELDQKLEQQNRFLWFLPQKGDASDQDIDVAMDETMLEQALHELAFMDPDRMVEPVDAHLEYQEGAYVVIPETYGSTVEEYSVLTVVENAIYEGVTEVNLQESGCYEEPQIWQDNTELIRECEELNKLIQVEITYEFGDRSELVDADLISQWISFADDFTYSLDEDLIFDYVHDLGLKYDTFGLKHTFTTHAGKTITLNGGDYGWCIQKQKTTEQLKELIEAGENVSVEPIYLYSGTCRDTNDIGDFYIEVSIEEQMMYMYKDGKCIVSTPVVTGCVENETETPSGSVWAIDGRIRDYTLSGQDYDSEVSYWMPFNGNVGIHDADWRTEFGGDIYLKNGSHGCINTPVDVMPTVYENARIGMPVIVY